MKFRFYQKQVSFLLLVFFSVVAFSQQSIINAPILSEYNNALILYNNKAYAAAQKTFFKVSKIGPNSSNLKANASYYDAMCAIKLNETDADKKVINFVKENPNSNKKNKIYFNVGNYYFANKKVAHSLKWFTKVDANVLSKENKKELNFKMGYGLLVSKNLTLAKTRFLPLINDPKYGNDSRYYYGYIAYKLEDYGIAESTLKEIADNESYRVEISYYLLDISFKAGKFKRCIKVGQELIKTVRKKEKSNISKIIGESFFNLKKYKEAIPFLEGYSGKKGKWNNTDLYLLGYSYYKVNDFENAINSFNKIIDEKNNVSQNAYYHLGECYLKLKNKTAALNAFKSASEMDFNKKIKEDAALNYVKLSYEEGNPFKSVAEVLQNYLKEYPKSIHYDEINKLIVTSFIHQQDYQGALDYLEKKKSKENNILILEVFLYRGIQLFNLEKTEEALPYFIESNKSENLEIVKLTTVDKTRQYSEVICKNLEAELLENSSDSKEPIIQAIDAGRIMLAADSLGASQTMIDKAVDYAKERKQFGRAIGSFQAVKHMCAEMAADLEPCYALVWHAAHCHDHSPAEARLMACHAKAHVSEMSKSIAKKATEVHGGMGFTDLLGLHYWFKRIGLNRQILGSPELVREEAYKTQV